MAHGNQRHNIMTISTRPHLLLKYNVDLTLNRPLNTFKTVILECIYASRPADYTEACLNTHVAT